MEQAQIDKVLESYKEKGASIDKITMDVSKTDTAVGYFIKPSRQVLSPMIAIISTDPVRAAEIWVQSCLITEISDPRFLTDDSFLYSVMPHVNSLVVLKKTSLTSV